MTSSAVHLPSQFQLSLALAIAKSKPAGLSIREYVLKVKQHLVQGSRDQDYGSEKQYLDAAGYWHNMLREAQKEIEEIHSQSQRDVDRLQTRNLELEHENQRLRREVKPASEGKGAKVGQKRKKNDQKDVGALKHKKLDTGKSVTVEPNLLDLDAAKADSSILEDAAGTGPIAARHLYSIIKLYRQIEPEVSALAYHLTQAAKSLAEHVSSSAIDNQKQLLKASLVVDKRQRAQSIGIATSAIHQEFNGVQRAAGRSFLSLFSGLKTLWLKDTESVDRHHGATTHVLISAFGTLLSAIEDTCVLHAQQYTEPMSPTKDNLKVSGKSMKPKKPEKALIPAALTTLFRVLLSNLKPSLNGPHTALFEGILYLLLERTANRLFLLTFGHKRGETIEEDIELAEQHEDQVIKPIVLKAAATEVVLLVQLLERTLRIAPGFLGSLNPTPASTAKSSRTSTSTAKTMQPRPSLSIAAKEKLQRTLVQCMFGDVELRGDDLSDTEDDDAQNKNEFIEVLKKPFFAGPMPAQPRFDDVDTPQWFVEEIWKLVGWDILTRDGDLEW